MMKVISSTSFVRNPKDIQCVCETEKLQILTFQHHSGNQRSCRSVFKVTDQVIVSWQEVSDSWCLSGPGLGLDGDTQHGGTFTVSFWTAACEDRSKSSDTHE